jgi:catechol 2,3-dioxygenase-like lactoylglutathione lyase family enzyme
MPAITGILETALYVDDLARAIHFYEDLFGFARMASDNRFCAFNVAGRDVLILFKSGGSTRPIQLPGGILPGHAGRGPAHFAFAIPAADFDSWLERLRSRDIKIESIVEWPLGGRSVYFLDPDGNLGELATPKIWPNY